MLYAGSCYLTVANRQDFGADRGAPTVVWLRGEHDLATATSLSETIAEAIALEDDELVIDLSQVTFISAATIGVIIRSRETLRARSRALTLRAPTKCVRRLFEVCELSQLLGSEAAGTIGDADGIESPERLAPAYQGGRQLPEFPLRDAVLPAVVAPIESRIEEAAVVVGLPGL